MSEEKQKAAEAFVMKQKELQDWRATLTKEEDETVDRMIREQGEEHVLSILGHLKNEFEIARIL